MLRRTARSLLARRSPVLLQGNVWGDERSIIKHAGPKGLDQVVNFPKFCQLTKQEACQMWLDTHEFTIQYVGMVLSGEAYDAIRVRLQRCPYFVIPVFRDKGIFNVVVNNLEDYSLVCPLGEYQKVGGSVEPHLIIQFFPELQKDKGVVFARAELKDKVLNKIDASHVLYSLIRYYSHPKCFRFVEEFNKNANEFDYHMYLRHMKEDAKLWIEGKKLSQVEIKDKEFKWK